MSFLCTTINKEVSHHQCMNECQYFFKSACIDKMNEAYNQALEDILAKVKSNHYLLSDRINSTDYGMFTCGIEQAIDELKR